AHLFAQPSTSWPPVNPAYLVSLVLSDWDPALYQRRGASAVAALTSLVSTGEGRMMTLGVAEFPQQPLPCRLSTQELVDLLKQPFAIGFTRRVILDDLEARYCRRFADQWHF